MSDIALNYRFKIEIGGVTQAYCQTVQDPSSELKEIQYGTPGDEPNTKVPGGASIGDLVIGTIVPAPGGDKAIWAKFMAARKGLRNEYVDTGFIIETDALRNEVSRFMLVDCWIKKIESSERNSDKESSDKLIRTLTFSVKDYIPM